MRGVETMEDGSRRTSARQRTTRPTAHSSALDALRAAREGESRVDQLEGMDDEDDVYEEVTEDQYQELVRKRQQADDFVVDDDGLGYADDGEEFIGRIDKDGDEDGRGGGQDKGGSRKGVNGKMNADTLRRKARKINKLEDGLQSSNIKKYLQTGSITAVGPGSMSHVGKSGVSGRGGNLDLDDMLSDLTSNPMGGSSASKRKHGQVTPQSSCSRRSPASSSGSRLRTGAWAGGGSSRISPPVTSTWTVRDYEDNDDSNTISSSTGGGGGSGSLTHDLVEADDNGCEGGDQVTDSKAWSKLPPFGDFDRMEVVTHGDVVGAVPDAPQLSDGDMFDGPPNCSGVTSSVSLSAPTAITKSTATSSSGTEAGEDATSVRPRSRFERMKQGNAITVTAAAEVALRPKSELAPSAPPGDGNAVPGLKTANEAAETGAPYMPSLDFKGPQYALSETPSTPASAVPSMSAWLQKDKEGEFMTMFWLDACEQNGTIYLMGKIATEAPDAEAGGLGGEKGGAQTYVSACVVIHGIERELLVLPRVLADNTPNEEGIHNRAGALDVYKEMGSVLVPSVIPRNTQGEKFRCKAVKRKYAFGDIAVPRGETEYLKIKYPAQFPALPPEVCEAGGKSFQAIFGARTPLLESFLIKRKLMGPCWVMVRNPKVNSGPVSWCKVEVAVHGPKLVAHMPDAAEDGSPPPPPPPVVTMSLSMKTIVSPSTHTHEVVALATLVHREVRMDGPTDEGGEKMSSWVGIRPLGQSAGDDYPKVFPHDVKNEVNAVLASARAGRGGVPVQTLPNERALLSLFFQKLQQEDPDIIVAHNLMGFDFDVLISRAVHNKLSMWSKIGRLRRNKPPRAYSSSSGMKGLGGSFNASVAGGRLLCDTYLSAKEFLRETTYSLTHLAGSQLKAQRGNVDPGDVLSFFGTAKDIIRLAQHTAFDASLVQRLMFKLQVIPLSCQLTGLSGNLWSRTMRGGRAERIEYLLLHEFHNLKYLTPEKLTYGNGGMNSGAGAKKGSGTGRERGGGGGEGGDVDAEDKTASGGGRGGGGGGGGARRKKAAYAGGLVLEPKKGLYDEYILLLDFNSLYPSIIQEYNLCFTTMDWAAVEGTDVGEERSPEGDGDDRDEPGEGMGQTVGVKLPSLPEEGQGMGVLPRVIRTLVARRGVVKKMLKKEQDPAKKQELDIRQKALKLTANSMYGCLGFSFSRFYAKPIAALVTAMGRESLQRTVDLSEQQLGLEVIYGDTDSVMINTHSTDLKEVKEIGNKVKREVNKLYKSLELDLDGVFKSMLLLKKKKYAALVVVEQADGSVTYEKEMKGLDLVRREWCVLSKGTGKFILDQILSGEARETVVEGIHDHLEALAASMRAGEVPVDKYVITKGLNKAPHEYPDAKSQPHVQVALMMQKVGKSVNVGHHIPYVMCKVPGASSPAERARHPEEVLRSNGELEVDVEWYLGQQIVPPVSRLCEPIEGTSMAVIAEKMGLDASKYSSQSHVDLGAGQDDWAFTPTSRLPDHERFKGTKALWMTCRLCGQEAEFQGVFAWDHMKGVGSASDVKSGLMCPNANCRAAYWGAGSEAACVSTLYQKLTLAVRNHLQEYYQTQLQCDDSSCGLRTRSTGVMGVACPAIGCQGRLVQEYSDKALYDQLKYLETLFDVDRAQSKVSERFNFKPSDLQLPPDHRQILGLVSRRIQDDVESSGYNWIRPSLWSSVFNSSSTRTGSAKSALRA